MNYNERRKVFKMLLIINPKGVLNVIASFVIVLPLSWGNYIEETPGFILLGLLFMMFDLVIRRPDEVKDLFHPDTGGHFFFIPMWIIGIIAMVILPFA